MVAASFAALRAVGGGGCVLARAHTGDEGAARPPTAPPSVLRTTPEVVGPTGDEEEGVGGGEEEAEDGASSSYLDAAAPPPPRHHHHGRGGQEDGDLDGGLGVMDGEGLGEPSPSERRAFEEQEEQAAAAFEHMDAVGGRGGAWGQPAVPGGGGGGGNARFAAHQPYAASASASGARSSSGAPSTDALTTAGSTNLDSAYGGFEAEHALDLTRGAHGGLIHQGALPLEPALLRHEHLDGVGDDDDDELEEEGEEEEGEGVYVAGGAAATTSSGGFGGGSAYDGTEEGLSHDGGLGDGFVATTEMESDYTDELAWARLGSGLERGVEEEEEEEEEEEGLAEMMLAGGVGEVVGVGQAPGGVEAPNWNRSDPSTDLE